MKKVLLLGAGLVARPLIHYLLDQDYYVVIATNNLDRADELLEGRQNSRTEFLELQQPEILDGLVEEADVVVSLLPYTWHVKVAEVCIEKRKHLVTTSYVSPAMRELETRASSAGIAIINELGLDPGIDHMSAMKIIHDVEARNGRITSFKSYCGGLPAPDANDNPFGYKFSWSPKGVVMAGRNNAQYLHEGKVIQIDGKDLFRHHFPITVPDADDFEFYPNRDSLSYIETYGLEGVRTMFRGTFRYPGWCKTWSVIADLGYLDDEPRNDLDGITLAEFTASITGIEAGAEQKSRVAEKASLKSDDAVIERLEWLGLFSDDKLLVNKGSNLDVLAAHLLEKMAYKPRERDMVLLYHEFEAEFQDGHNESITSTLMDFGIPDGDSAMARTVSLPAAIAVKLLSEGKIKRRGVLIPVYPELYKPVLKELESLNIRCIEKTVKKD